jgi:hypothetical protein
MLMIDVDLLRDEDVKNLLMVYGKSLMRNLIMLTMVVKEKRG